MNIQQSPIPAIVVAAPLLAAFVMPVLGRWARPAMFPVTIAALLASGGASVAAAIRVLEAGPLSYYMGGWEPPWGIALQIDHLSALMLLIVSAAALAVGVFARGNLLKGQSTGMAPIHSLYLLLVSGLAGLVVTADLFNLYVFLEITSLASYALVASGTGAAVVSAFRYLVLGSIGAAFYLLAVAYLYGATGTLNMADLATLLPQLYHSPAVLAGFALFVIGIAIKMALFPLHTWLPAAYADAPAAVSAVMAATTTKVAAYVFIRIMFYVFEPTFSIDLFPVTALLGWLGALAMLCGSVLAIAQTDLKRLLAYSSVAQIGYVVLGLGLANAAGFTGSVLHLVNHACMKGGLFLAAGAIIYRTGLRDVRDFGALAVQMPWTAAGFAVCALALIGIPPTGGFFSKLYLILGAIDAEQWGFVAVIVLSSALAIAYLMPVVRRMYAASPAAGGGGAVRAGGVEVPWSMLIPILGAAAGSVLLGLSYDPLVDRFIAPAMPAGLAR